MPPADCASIAAMASNCAAQPARAPLVPSLHDLLRSPWSSLPVTHLQAHLAEALPRRILVQADPVEGGRAQADAIVAGRFRFIGETHHWAGAPAWLDNPSRDIEWHILLHKFYYAVGLGEAWRDTGDTRYLDTWSALLTSWIGQVPPGYIAADVTGRRLQNWIQAHSLFAAALTPALHARFLASVHAQVRWLCANLHPARNHRTLELHAILLAGVAFPEFEEAAHWTAFALAQLADNMRHDLLPDGVHCEQSTDYHHLVLRNYLNARRLCARNGIAVPAGVDAMIERGLEFSMHAHRPDGRVPALSDGDVNDYRELLLLGHELYGRGDMLYAASGGTRGEPPAQRCRWFAHSGYAFLRSGWGEHGNRPDGERFSDARYLVFDCGPLGAGNHGHLDLLSFEAFAYGKALVVDPGRYTYHEDPAENWRVRFRGTGYHNTVRVDGLEQTRYRQGPTKYKISGPAPDFSLECFQTGTDLDYLCGVARSHEYDAVHERRIAFVRRRYWVILDTLRGAGTHRYDLFFHLAAAAWRRTALVERDGLIRCVSPGLLMAHLPDGDTRFALEEGFVSERYGEKMPAPVVRFTRDAVCARFVTVLYPYPLEAPALRIETGSELRVSVCERGVRTTDCLALASRHATLRTTTESATHG